MKPKIILDSGAYSAFRKGIHIDIDEYLKYMLNQKDFYEDFFNLDVIGNAKMSYKNWRYLKQQGANPIPVYHIGTDEKWLEKYLQHTDHIALGAIANLSTNQRLLGLDNIWKKYILDTKGNATCKVHGLGLTAIPIIHRYPWYSVDSLTPIILAAFGSVSVPFINEKKECDYTRIINIKISDQAKHPAGANTNWPGLPKTAQMQYIALFEEHGFLLGMVYNQVRRKKGKEQSKLFDLKNGKEAPKEERTKTLANDYVQRAIWNIFVWDQMRSSMEGKIIYLGTSNKSNMEHIFTDKRVKKHDVLVSFPFLSDGYYEELKKYKQT